MSDAKHAPDTLAAQGLGWIAPIHRDLAPPIHPSSTFERGADGSFPGGRVYARDQSPAYDQAEALLAALEGAHQALLFPSGMAAATTLLQALEPGSRVLAPRAMYWALRNWMQELAARGQIALDFYDNADTAALRARIATQPPRLLWVETPANPTWEITDLTAACAAARAHGSLVAVDSTVPTPVLTRPLELGADFVMHSATKYLNGHSDVVAGALACRADSPVWTRVRQNRALGGAILGPFEAWLLLRGMRTLALRVRHASASALAIARTFERDPRLAAVLYPGLPGHPGHATAAAQMQGGFGAMLSIRVAAGEQAALAATGRLQVFKRATSLGSVESLAEHRFSVEGPGSQCPPDLIRLSVGIEAVEDLLADLDQALG
ncbi:PLP-dependent transferase [Pseudothauera nasutitermitis]|uniref:PLP-dependent transferase n=1 Tax=Pseudothauera nasutitermitis TaxID=2565930 RepID=A0A4S4B494_9RHOO|nr:PLP-dependent aspartate aminotransferase family protein [Pseudothauera nasutitermitis]THF66560.1 PLP-dependent transferase [Pseudothauera nasutitermitis]